MENPVPPIQPQPVSSTPPVAQVPPQPGVASPQMGSPLAQAVPQQMPPMASPQFPQPATHINPLQMNQVQPVVSPIPPVVSAPSNPVLNPSPTPITQPNPTLSHAAPAMQAPPIVSQPVHQEKKSSSMVMTIGFLFILVGVAGGMYYLGYTRGSSSVPTQTVIPEQTQVAALPTEVPATATPEPVQFTPLPPIEQWVVYSNTPSKYEVSYPANWKVTAENYNVPAGPASNPVQIFNPEDKPETSKYSGMTINYIGKQPELNLANFQQVSINGLTMYSGDTTEGKEYYVLIPNTDEYIKISGAGGNTANPITNEGVQKILNTFKFVQ